MGFSLEYPALRTPYVALSVFLSMSQAGPLPRATRLQRGSCRLPVNYLPRSGRSIFDREGGHTRVGGEVKVSPLKMRLPGMRIREISAENPNVPLEVEAGYAMSTT